MKTKITLLFSILFFTNLVAQRGEFKLHENGLIYDVNCMNKLEKIVDSLNLQHKTCDPFKTYYSKKQAVGYSFTIDGGKAKLAKQKIDEGITFENLQNEFPNAKIEQKALILKSSYTNNKGEQVVNYSEFSFVNDYGNEVVLSQNDDEKFNKNWVYQYAKFDNSLRGFYFSENFKSLPLKREYADMISYSECLIDTTSTKFKADAEYGYVDLPDNWVDLSKGEKEDLLRELRSTRVVGSCSQDNSPRIHAINIAMVSAEVTNWEVFLKSHLDIMNDRFDRVSDGSYAWAQRKTYIKELEVLNINVLDLMIGTSLRVENPSSNHYYSSIGRIGRALSESENKEEIKEKILSMIADNQLDDFNRGLSYFLFLNFNYHIEDQIEKDKNKLLLAASVASLPQYIKERLKKK